VILTKPEKHSFKERQPRLKKKPNLKSSKRFSLKPSKS